MVKNQIKNHPNISQSGCDAKFTPLLNPHGYRSMGLKSGCVVKRPQSRRRAIF